MILLGVKVNGLKWLFSHVDLTLGVKQEIHNTSEVEQPASGHRDNQGVLILPNHAHHIGIEPGRPQKEVGPQACHGRGTDVGTEGHNDVPEAGGVVGLGYQGG